MERVLGWLVAAALTAHGGAALAGEDEWVVALEPEGTLLTPHGGSPTFGAGGQLTAWFGVTEAFWLGAAGGAWVYPDDAAPDLVAELVATAVVALDMLRTIPFLEGGLGADLIDGSLSPVLRVGIGADYLVSEDFSVGGVVRYRPVFGSGEHVVTLGLRFALRGEW